MILRVLLSTLLMLLVLPVSSFGEEEEAEVRRLDIAPTRAIFDAANWDEPVELMSSADAAEYFDEDAVAVLDEQVDWDRQMLLVFAWRGSGQDRMVAEQDADAPDSVRFAYRPGRTRDLRPHVYVFVLPIDKAWSVEMAGR